MGKEKRRTNTADLPRREGFSGAAAALISAALSCPACAQALQLPLCAHQRRVAGARQARGPQQGGGQPRRAVCGTQGAAVGAEHLPPQPQTAGKRTSAPPIALPARVLTVTRKKKDELR